MKDRIFLLIETKELTFGKFADEIGVERSTMSHIKSDRSKPSLDMAQKVLERYPEVSAEWLILGRGPMFRQTNDSQELDLFSQIGLNDSKSEVNSDKVESIQATISTESKKKDLLTEDSVNVVGKKEEPQRAFFNPPKPERVVERVMIFYSDQTFEELKK